VLQCTNYAVVLRPWQSATRPRTEAEAVREESGTHASFQEGPERRPASPERRLASPDWHKSGLRLHRADRLPTSTSLPSSLVVVRTHPYPYCCTTKYNPVKPYAQTSRFWMMNRVLQANVLSKYLFIHTKQFLSLSF